MSLTCNYFFDIKRWRQADCFFFFLTGGINIRGKAITSSFDNLKFNFDRLKFRQILCTFTMPRTSHYVHLTDSEDNALSARGYKLSNKLGEGAYAKVCYLII